MTWIPGLYARRRPRDRGLPSRTIEVLETRRLLADGIAPQPGPPLTGSPGVPLNNVVVATFTITDSSGSPGTKWNAHITWGDGQPDDKRIVATPGPNNTFQIVSSHTYAQAGNYKITVMIAVPGSHRPNDNIVMTTAKIQSAATLQSIAVTPANPTLAKGASQQFNAIGTFSDSSTQNLTNQVTWASATPTVATITNTGLATAVAMGSSLISASLNGVTGSTTLNVSAATLQTIVVTPVNPTVTQGNTQQFSATGAFSDGTMSTITGQVAWASSNPAVATISAAGLATGVAPGNSTISATLSGVSGSTGLTVAPKPPPPPPPFPVAGVLIQARNQKTFKGIIAYFNELHHTRTQDFHAQVDWGDGSKVTSGHIHKRDDGRFAVISQHRYIRPGIYTIAITVRDPKGRKAVVTSIIHVQKP